jgi:hypothetical protein
MLRRIDAVGRNDPARGCLSSEAVSGASSEVARRNRSGRIAPEPLQGIVAVWGPVSCLCIYVVDDEA